MMLSKSLACSNQYYTSKQGHEVPTDSASNPYRFLLICNPEFNWQVAY